jgi:transcriptional regulator with XRE-family HTH domain
MIGARLQASNRRCEVERASFDAEGFFAALDSTRQAKDLNWKQVANEAHVSASTLTRMGQGRRPDVDSLAALARWSGLDPADFIRGGSATAAKQAEPLAMISTYLRGDPNLSEDAAAALDEVIKATYERLRKRGRTAARVQDRGE